MFEGKQIITEDGLVANREVDPAYRSQVYEVIRLNDGIPVFFDDHFRRFEHSCLLAGVRHTVSSDELARNMVLLSDAEGIRNGNIRYAVSDYGSRLELAAGFIPSSYPTAEMYRSGVATDLLFEERANPNAKIANAPLRQRADELMSSRGLFEAILVNRNGAITEGSRSNIFFISAAGTIYTAPLDMVLGGITREVVIEEALRCRIPLKQEPLAVDALDSIVAAFISGTSPGVLPIARIGATPLNPLHPLIGQLSDLYSKRVEEDMERFRRSYML